MGLPLSSRRLTRGDPGNSQTGPADAVQHRYPGGISSKSWWSHQSIVAKVPQQRDDATIQWMRACLPRGSLGGKVCNSVRA